MSSSFVIDSQVEYDSTSQANITTTLSIDTEVKVAQNEPMVNHVFNRNAKTLLENDISLYELYKKVFSQLNITDYNSSTTYQVGDLVWFRYDSDLYLLKCIINNNTTTPAIQIEDATSDHPQPSDLMLKQSGWENKNKYLTILDYGIAKLLKSKADEAYDDHGNDISKHPYGKVSLSADNANYIGKKLLMSDMSNINDSREKIFFPQVVQKLEAGVAILNGYMRNYGKILEYDILVKLAASEASTNNQIFSSSSALSANTLQLQLFTGLTKNSVSYQENDKYFYNSQTMDIFSYDSSDDLSSMSKVGLLKQANRNNYVNTYSAMITFPKPFPNRNYMVFANSILCQTNGVKTSDGKNVLVPSQNDIAICNKTRESITLLNITFPCINKLDEDGFNASKGGLVSNSFHCKVIGVLRT